MPTRPPMDAPPVLSPVQVAQLFETMKRVDKRGEVMEADLKALSEKVGDIDRRTADLDLIELAREQERNKAARAELAEVKKELAALKAEVKEQAGGYKVIASLVLGAVGTAFGVVAFFLRS